MNSSFQVVDNDDDADGDEEDDALSSNMIYQIDRVNRTLHRTGANTKSTSVLAITKPDGISLSRPNDSSKTKLSIDMDEIQFRSLLVETQVVSTVNYIKWKWDLIVDIIEGPLLNPKRLEEAIKSTKFLKRLIGFYRPFKYRFSDAKNTKPNQRYVRTGCILIKSLLQTTEGVQYLAESKLLRQLAECLAQLDKVSLRLPNEGSLSNLLGHGEEYLTSMQMSGLISMTPLFARKRVSDTLTGGYFNILGALSSDPQGLVMLERWRMVNMFYHIIDLEDRGDLVQILLSNMDFTMLVYSQICNYETLNICRDSHLRVMLSKALTACPKVQYKYIPYKSVSWY